MFENYLPIYYDKFFKALFVNNKNEMILKTFLETYFKIKIENIKILNVELPVKKIKEKVKHVDVLVEIENKIINIEVNPIKNKNVIPRNMAYIFSIYAQNFQNNLKNKEERKKEYIQLNLNKYSLNKRRTYKEVYRLKNEYGEILSKKIEIHEINIDYFHELWYSINKLQVILKNRKRNIDNKMDREEYEKIEKLKLKIRERDEEIKQDKSILWMGLIGCKTKEEYEYILSRKEMGNMAKKIKKEVKFICDPSLAISIFDQEDIDWYDKEGIKETWTEIGERRGEKRGKKQTKLEIAKNLLNLNFDIQAIISATGLSKNQLQQLKKNIENERKITKKLYN